MGLVAEHDVRRPPLVELRDFGVAFGGRVVLRELALELHGPRISILGHGGAGKSTLLRTLAGLHESQPELRITGEARYLGRPLGDGPRPWLVGQKATLLLSTVLENIAQALVNRGELSPCEQRSLTGSLLGDLFGSEAPPLDARVVDLPLDMRRGLAIARGVAARTDLLLVDEPTTGLRDDGRKRVMDLLCRVSETMPVVHVTHHLGDVRELGGELVLLVEGRAVERGAAAEFFAGPRTAAGRRYLETGTCYFDPDRVVAEPIDVPAAGDPCAISATAAGDPCAISATAAGDPGAIAATAVAEIDSAWSALPVSRLTPIPSRYLHWVIPQRLLGMPRPGIVRDLEDDLLALSSLGVSQVFCLEETLTVPESALRRHGMSVTHVPIEDMKAPSIAVARMVCISIREHLARGRVVAVHCLGGMGRTGSILAAYFIFMGASAEDALRTIRLVQPRFVQSDEQVEFLSSFEGAFRGQGGESSQSDVTF